MCNLIFLNEYQFFFWVGRYICAADLFVAEANIFQGSVKMDIECVEVNWQG